MKQKEKASNPIDSLIPPLENHKSLAYLIGLFMFVYFQSFDNWLTHIKPPPPSLS